MSVEYRSGVAKGWKLTEDEVAAIPEEIREDLIDYGHLICLNGWVAESDYLLTFCKVLGAEEGTAIDIGDFEFDVEDQFGVTEVFQHYFPVRADEKPNLWLFTEVY